MANLKIGDRVYTRRKPDRIMEVEDLLKDSTVASGGMFFEGRAPMPSQSPKVICKWKDDDGQWSSGTFRENMLILKK